MTFRAWLGLEERSQTATSPLPGIAPPSRASSAPLSDRRAITVPAAYRAIQVLCTAVSQLTLDVHRGGTVMDVPPSIVRVPDVAMDLDQWLEAAVMSLVVDGNLFVLVNRVDGILVNLKILNPFEVVVNEDYKTGRPYFGWRDHTYSDDEIIHRARLRLPGTLRGISPIEAARRGLTFTDAARDHVSAWFDNAGQPTGILSSDQHLTAKMADAYRNAWNGLDGDGNPISRADNPSGVKVLGAGLKYDPLILKPSDALWLEAQEFTTLEIARLFGVPASLMLVAPEGGTETYSNVEQEWIGFVRFTLMSYLRPIECVMTKATVRGQEVRFNLEGLLRSDTMTRYQSYEIALRNGWMTVADVCAIEGIPTPSQNQENINA